MACKDADKIILRWLTMAWLCYRKKVADQRDTLQTLS